MRIHAPGREELEARRYERRIRCCARRVLEIETDPGAADVREIEQLGFATPAGMALTNVSAASNLVLAIPSTSAGVLMLFSLSKRIAQKPSPSNVYAYAPNTATRARNGASGTFASASVQASSRFSTSSDWNRAVCSGVYAPKKKVQLVCSFAVSSS